MLEYLMIFFYGSHALFLLNTYAAYVIGIFFLEWMLFIRCDNADMFKTFNLSKTHSVIDTAAEKLKLEIRIDLIFIQIVIFN